MPARTEPRTLVTALAGLALLPALSVAQPSDAPLAVRNDVRQPGEEVLVLRHQKLAKGGHEGYYRISRAGVWPWFEKLGTRVVGQWQVIHPDGSPEQADHDNGYRLARYASYEHWWATRRGQYLAGNGPDYQANVAALRDRKHFEISSDGAYFLQGVTATIRPHYMPALEEKYERVETAPADGPRPVRNDVAWPAREIIALDHWKIRKGTAKEFIEAGVEGVWPYLEKVGARAVGLWKVLYPPESAYTERPEYDEVMMMVRYAGYAHWKAARHEEIVELGGDGRDWQAYERAQELQGELAREVSVKFLGGYLHQSPPWFRPGLGESYRRVE